MNDEFYNDPENWKLGIFYFNPKDKRWFLPKRLPGMGFTLNFAHPNAFFVIAGIAILAIISARA